MDSAADSLLALSNTAVALAATEPEDDDDRSSSLSELEDGTDVPETDPIEPFSGLEGDSEAETERIDDSPDKISKKKGFGISPSKLAHTVHVDDNRPEVESLTDSAISSPVTTDSETPDEDRLSDGGGVEDDRVEEEVENKSPNKRKREDDVEDKDRQARSRRRRTGSEASQEPKSELESEDEDRVSQRSREATIDPEAEAEGQDELDEDEDNQPIEKADIRQVLKAKPRQSLNRSLRRKTKEEHLPEADPDMEDDAEGSEDTDDADVDDIEAAAKSEEELAKKTAAMEALSALEKHFAVLRDRLYDERIATLNQELVQLAETKPIHHELLRQLECVQKYRDEKFETEQKLLVYKVGALKNKSVAERSQIHSAYFQTIRDIREKHLERISEHFYRIQRDRFKAEAAIPSYTIPFPDRRSQQIRQQTSYNKEVSILSGVAKYIGFPAAPELLPSRQKDADDDMQKMGISISQARRIRAPPRSALPNTYNAVLSGPAAEEQFLEQTPWANPQHPIHRLGLSRRNSSRSPMDDSYQTPANQRVLETTQPAGSASTIPENPSAPISSAFNTPHDLQAGVNKGEPAGFAGNQNHWQNPASPLEVKRISSTSNSKINDVSAPHPNDTSHDIRSSPLMARAQNTSLGNQSDDIKSEKHHKFAKRSPFPNSRDSSLVNPGLTGLGRFSVK